MKAPKQTGEPIDKDSPCEPTAAHDGVIPQSPGRLTVTSRPQVQVRHDAPPDLSDAYVASHSTATPYHRRAWLDVIGRAFGHETRYLVAESGRDVIGVLPLVLFRSTLFGRFAVSIPFLNYGGILADTPEVEAALLERAIAETRRIGGSHL